MGAEHRRQPHRSPHARVLQGDPRQRQDRPVARVDRHLARQPSLQSRGLTARERSHRNHLHGQLLFRRPAHPRRGGPNASLARHVDRVAGRRRDRRTAFGLRRLRVGRGSRQWVAAGGPCPHVRDQCRSERADPRPGLDLRPRRGLARPGHAPGWSRKCTRVRCRHRAVVLGFGRRAHWWWATGGFETPAGHGESPRRHGSATRLAAGRARVGQSERRFGGTGRNGEPAHHRAAEGSHTHPYGYGQRQRWWSGCRSRGVARWWQHVASRERPRQLELHVHAGVRG